MEKEQKSIVNEPIPDYENGETELLRSALKRSYEERFHMMANLMKMSLMFRNAKITHKNLSSE